MYVGTQFHSEIGEDHSNGCDLQVMYCVSIQHMK
jgi:hypothetical protein